MTERPKILLVDDDPKFQKLIGRILEKHGFAITVCNDGLEAKAFLDKNPNPTEEEVRKALRMLFNNQDLSTIIKNLRTQESIELIKRKLPGNPALYDALEPEVQRGIMQ